MRIYTYRPPASAGRSRAAVPPPLAPGVSWARFGRELILYTDDAPGESVPHRALRGARLAPRLTEATREQLHVVVQNGRLFQQHHPDVPVLHDRGRFLLVQLAPERARRLQAERETCYGVMPLAENQVVFEEREARAAGAPVPLIQALIDQLDRAPVEASLVKLVSFGTRHSTSAGYTGAASWARQELDAMGYVTRLQDVAVGSGVSHNIIADREGSGADPRRVVLVTAHLDSINLRGGPAAPAPGADDNGSGSAGLLEIARVLQEHRAVDDLRLILFGGEEEGLFGSKQHVAGLAAPERSRLGAVVNMDMIGALNAPSRGVLLEGAPVSQSVIDGLSDAAATYTQLTVETSLNPFASDHVPFIDAGVPAVLTIEGADSANDTVHSEADALDRIDYDLLLEILRMNVAFVAGAIGLAA